MIRERNVILQGKHGRPFLADVYYVPDNRRKPVVILSHGFKGFKDWGPFDLIADAFAANGFVLVKFNFSHNGTTIDHPLDFVDLEAFGNDNISIQLSDLGVVMDWVCSDKFAVDDTECDKSQICLLGHSRGGGISILKAREDARVKKLCTWASLNEFSRFWSKEDLEKIKRDGVIFLTNTRTNQSMPIKWQMYENYFANLQQLHIPTAVKEIKVPFLIIHGTADETIPYDYALEMQGWNKQAQLHAIQNGNHNFGGRHPWAQEQLSTHLEEALDETIKFFKQ